MNETNKLSSYPEKKGGNIINRAVSRSSITEVNVRKFIAGLLEELGKRNLIGMALTKMKRGLMLSLHPDKPSEHFKEEEKQKLVKNVVDNAIDWLEARN